ncbi:hypothetical protein AB4086_02530 [Vibrio splendidus]
MFEPIEFEMEPLQLVVSLPGLDSVSNGRFIPLDSLSVSSLSGTVFDGLFASGLSPEQSQELAQFCEDQNTEFFIFENPSNSLAVIRDVVINLVDKLFSDEMLNNIDFADIRTLNQYSDYLFAFNNKRSALDFMDSQQLGVITGGIHLAHGHTNSSEYETTNKELLKYISNNGFLYASYHSFGRSECTVLVGVRK